MLRGFSATVDQDGNSDFAWGSRNVRRLWKGVNFEKVPGSPILGEQERKDL